MRIIGSADIANDTSIIGGQWDSINIVDNIVDFTTNEPTTNGLFINTTSGTSSVTGILVVADQLMYTDNSGQSWHARSPYQFEFAYVLSSGLLYQYNAAWNSLPSGSPEVYVGNNFGVPPGTNELGIRQSDGRLYYASAGAWNETRFIAREVVNSDKTLLPNKEYILTSDVSVLWRLDTTFAGGDVVDIINVSNSGQITLTPISGNIGGKPSITIDRSPPYVCRITYNTAGDFNIEAGFNIDKKTEWRKSNFTYGATVSNPTHPAGAYASMLYRIFGRRVQIKLSYSAQSAGAPGSGIYTVTLPSSLSAKTSVIDLYSEPTGSPIPNQRPSGSVLGCGSICGTIASNVWVGNVSVMMYSATEMCFVIDGVYASSSSSTAHNSISSNAQQANHFSLDYTNLQMFVEADIPI